MKRQYIAPSVFCVKLDPKRTFLQGSIEQSEETVTGSDGGWAREDNNNTDDDNNNRGSIWDNAW